MEDRNFKLFFDMPDDHLLKTLVQLPKDDKVHCLHNGFSKLSVALS
jgi:hypothetical protein